MNSKKSNLSQIRTIHPLGMRVVVRILKNNNQTDSGLYLPEGSKEKQQQSFLAEVIEVATAEDKDTREDTNISGIPLGAKILIPKHAGTVVPWDEELRIVDTKEVLAIVDEVGVN